MGRLLSTAGGIDLLGVRGATLDGEMTLHERVGAWEMLCGVWERGTGCEGVRVMSGWTNLFFV